MTILSLYAGISLLSSVVTFFVFMTTGYPIFAMAAFGIFAVFCALDSENDRIEYKIRAAQR